MFLWLHVAILFVIPVRGLTEESFLLLWLAILSTITCVSCCD